jgi:RHS repeat-associated protein
MPDGADLALADPGSVDPQLASVIDAVLADPSAGPYDTYVARAYGRAVTTGRTEPASLLRPYSEGGLIAEPLIRQAAISLPGPQQQAVSAGVAQAISQYLDDVLKGQRILGVPRTEVMKHRQPDIAVMMYRGEFTHAGVDLQLSGAGIDFAFRRSYRNQAAYEGPLGSNWDHAYNIRLTEVDQTRLVMTTGTLGEETYALHSHHNYFVPPPGVDAMFEASGDSFVRRAPDGSRHVFARVPGTRYHDLERIENRFGNRLVFAHAADENRLLQRVDVNHSDRFVVFEYDDLGRISAIRDFTGRVWRYCYDDLNDLVAVTSPSTSSCPTGLTTHFEYRSAFVGGALQHNLARITDATGRMYLENDYGESPGTLEYDRVVRQRQGSGESYLDYEAVAPISEGPYSEPELPSLQVVHTKRNGHRVCHVYNTAGNLLYDQECVIRRGLPRLLQTRYRYNRDGRLTDVLSPEGVLTQYLYGRDWFLRRLAITDDEADSHPALTRAERQSFGRLLAVVRRAQTFGLLQLTSAARPWGSFPSVTDTIPDSADIIVKTTYEADFGQVTTVSHPRFTRSPLPDAANEHPRHAETLTRYEYSGPQALLSRIIQPVPTDADGGQGPQTITQLIDYDGRGRLREMIDADATVSRFTYFPPAAGIDATREGHLQIVEIDPGDLQIATRYDVDVLGRVIAVHLPRATGDGRFIERTAYNELDQVVETIESDPFFYTTRFTYDKTGNLQRWERDLVDSSGNPEHGGVEFNTFCHDAEASLTRETAGGVDFEAHHVTTHHYGPSGERTLTIRPAGNRVRYRYDERTQIVAITEGADSPEASTTRTEYDGDGRTIGIVDGRGNRTAYRLDAFGRVVEVEDPLGTVTRTTYDNSSNTLVVRTFERRPDGYYLLARSENTYDELNRRIRAARNRFDDVVGPFTRSELPQAQLSPGPGSIVSTKLFYDTMGRLVRTVNPINGETQFEHDAMGRLTLEIDPLGNETHRTYDAHGNLTRTEEVDIVRDATGVEIERLCFPAETQYDELDRRVVTTDGLGNTYRIEYDSRDLATRTLDPLSNETRIACNIFGRVATITRFLTVSGIGPVDATTSAVETSFEYDENDNMIAVTDPRGNKTLYTYDQLDRRRTVIYPDGTAACTNFDADDNVLLTKDGNGTQRHFTLDALGHMTRVDVDISQTLPSVEVSGATFQAYEYDGLGRLIRTENNYAVTRERYDSLDNPFESSLVVHPSLDGSLGPFTIRRRYDDAGFLIELEYPGGRRLTYDRDELSRVRSIRHIASGADYPGDPALAVPSEITSFEYAGRLPLQTRHAVGSITRYRYDATRRVVEMTDSAAGQLLLSQQYLYDGAGNVRVRQDDGLILTERHRFSYDALYRLVDATVGAVETFDDMLFQPRNTSGQPIENRQAAMNAQIGSLNLPSTPLMLEYDSTGNRIRQRRPSDLIYTPNTLDQLVHVAEDSSTPGRALDHNSVGDVIDDGFRQYVYDSEHRLVVIRDLAGDATHQFFHDAVGRRIAERVGAQTSLFVADHDDTILEIQDEHVLTHSVYSDVIDHPLQIATSGMECGVHVDLSGSVRLLTGLSAVAAAHYEYTPFGLLEPTSQEVGVANRIRFTGRRQEHGLECYDFRAREYDPMIGRFLQRDPAPIAEGTNLYAYANNNPLRYRDPYGRQAEDVSGTTAAWKADDLIYQGQGPPVIVVDLEGRVLDVGDRHVIENGVVRPKPDQHDLSEENVTYYGKTWIGDHRNGRGVFEMRARIPVGERSVERRFYYEHSDVYMGGDIDDWGAWDDGGDVKEDLGGGHVLFRPRRITRVGSPGMWRNIMSLEQSYEEYADGIRGLFAAVTAPMALVGAGGGGGLLARSGTQAARSGSYVSEAVFAQRSHGRVFSSGGRFGPLPAYGRSQSFTIEQVVKKLRSGRISPSHVPVEMIRRGETTYILNTRSARALERAGVTRDRWTVVNVTGKKDAERRLSNQLKRGGLDESGTSFLRTTGRRR